jgi:hypothetical protein
MSFNVNLLVTVIGSWRFALLPGLLLVQKFAVKNSRVPCGNGAPAACAKSGLPGPEMLMLVPRAGTAGWPVVCLYNATYADEIYYCSISSGSQKICRNILNTTP